MLYSSIKFHVWSI